MKKIYTLVLSFGLFVLSLNSVKAYSTITPVSSTNVNIGSCAFYFLGNNTGNCYSNPTATFSFKNVMDGPGYHTTLAYIYVTNMFASGLHHPAVYTYNYDKMYISNYQHFSRADDSYNNVGVEMIRLWPDFDSISTCIKYGATSCPLSNSVKLETVYCSSAYRYPEPLPQDPPSGCSLHSGITYNVSGRVDFALPVPVLSTNSLDFGDVQVGQSKTLTFTLTNAGNATDIYSFNTINGAISSGSPFKMTIFGDISVGTTKTVTVVFTPSAAGNTTGSYTFTPSNSSIATLIGSKTISFKGNGVVTSIPITPTVAPTAQPTTVVITSTPIPTLVPTSSNLSVSPTPTNIVTPIVIKSTSTTTSNNGNTGTNNNSTNIQPTAAPQIEVVLSLTTTDNTSLVKISTDPNAIQISDSGEIKLLGTGPINQEIVFFVYPEAKIFYANADGDGNWSLQITGLESGNHSIYYALSTQDVNADSAVKAILGEFEIRASQPVAIQKNDTDYLVYIVVGLSIFTILGLASIVYSVKNRIQRKPIVAI